MALHQYANNPQTALSGAVTAGVTAISVASAASFPARGKFTIIVDSEIMLVTGVTGTTWTVTRGHDGTSAAAHNNNALVTQILTVDSFLNAHAYDPRAYGAAGDGTTDDTAALQAALDAAPAGSRIRFPHGATYLVTSPLTISRSLHVEGHGATLKAGTDGADAWFKFTNVTRLSIRGLEFDDDNRGRTIVDLTACADALIEGCRFTGYSSAFGTSSTDSLLRISTSTDVRIRGNVFEDSGNADPNLNRCITLNDAGTNRVTITENTFRNVNQAIVINGTEGIVVANNTFDTVSDNGLYVLNPCQDLAVTGNTFRACEEAIVLAGGTGGTKLRNVRIVGNLFEGNTNKAVAFQYDTQHITITGNTFRDGTSHIVRRPSAVGTCENWNISGNVFTGDIGFAALLFDHIEGMVFSGNTLRMKFNAPSLFFFRADGTATNVLFTNNLLDDTGGTDAGRVRFAGTNSGVFKWGNTLHNLAFIEDNGAGTGQQGVGSIARGGATSLTSGVSATLNMTTADRDPHGFLNAANNRLLIPEGLGGRWAIISARATFASSTGRHILRIEQNASAIYLQDDPAPAAAGLITMTIGGPVFIADGDALTVTAFQGSGGAVNCTLDRVALTLIP